jgi:hypothetical protein
VGSNYDRKDHDGPRGGPVLHGPVHPAHHSAVDRELPFWQNYILFESLITRMHGQPEGRALFPMEKFTPDTGHILSVLADMEKSNIFEPVEERVNR